MERIVFSICALACFSLCHRSFALAFEGTHLAFVARDGVLQFLFALMDGLPLVLPVVLVANDVEEILVRHHVILPHDVCRTGNDLFGKPRLTGYL